ncbi:M12 family metallopeptidase, partial [Vibrio parahaemolyticus]|nr:M12 family metallopeptidase [Vibrio parahaemolyticus]
TIITIDPEFQDVIGQRLEMSPSDVQELNLLYSCSKCLEVLFIPVTKKVIDPSLCPAPRRRLANHNVASGRL